MKKVYRQFYFIFYLFINLLFGQELLYDELSSKLIQSKEVKAVLGSDMSAPAGTTVLLDASMSIPNNGSLTFEWTFPPNLLFKEDYIFDNSESVIPYTDSEILNNNQIFLQNNQVSIKRIITRNKFIELDMPMVKSNSEFNVVLRVQNQKGKNDSDTIKIIVSDYIDDSYSSEFSNMDSTDQISSFAVYDESSQNRESLTETVINTDYITIQPLNRSRLNPMEVDIINSYIYESLKELGMRNILNPNRKIPATMRVKKLFERSRAEPDTVLMIYVDTLSILSDRSNFQDPPIDTLYNTNQINDSTSITDTTLVYRRYETVTSIDTLFFTEVVDTVLSYDFDCKNYDCATENAFLEQAGKILTWGINDYSEFELHFFDLKDVYDTEPISYWYADTIVFSPYADSLLRYPKSIAFDSKGSLVAVSGNRQSVSQLGFELHPESIIPSNNDLQWVYPSGVCSGYLGELYVTDKDNHSVYKIYDGRLTTIYSASRDEDGVVLNDEPSFPTSIRIDPEGNLVVLFTGDGSVHQFDPKGVRTILLQSGDIENPKDIALSSEGSLYVTSPKQHQIFQVAMDGSVIPVAGSTNGMNESVVDGSMALESYLGEPVSIDFDASNRLYIADNVFSSVRVVDTDGVLYTITDKDNRVRNINQLRVNNKGMTTLYTTHMLDHQITRIRYRTLSLNSQLNYIHYPYYIIKKEGVYGLEGPIKDGLRSVLIDLLPKERISFLKKISESNRRFAAYIKDHPLIFGLLLLLLNQVLTSSLSDGGSIDLPPDFPF